MPIRRKIPAQLRLRVAQAAAERCSYCRSPEWVGIPMVIEHIIPLIAGGRSEFSNLCWACYRCNEFKGVKTHATDPLMGVSVSLFNPREQVWLEHFAWGGNGLYVVGLTAIGRATCEALRLNHEWLVRARRIWISAGWHPPLD